MSDGPPKVDRSKWIVPVVVAVIAAVGTVIAAVLPSVLAGDDDAPAPAPSSRPPAQQTIGGGPPATEPETTTTEPAVALTGMGLVLPAVPSYDLDGTLGGEGGDQIDDLFHSREALLLRGGARAAPLDLNQVPTPETCRAALAGGGTDSVAADQVRTGRSLCVVTSRQARGVVTLTRVTASGQPVRLSTVHFRYVIWKAS